MNKGCPDSKHQALINKRGLFLTLEVWGLGRKEFFSHTQSHSAQSTRSTLYRQAAGRRCSGGNLPSPVVSRGHPSPSAGPPHS